MANHKKTIQTGTIFGRLEVIEETLVEGCNKLNYLCRCVCGKDVRVRATALRLGRVKSCGCYRMETAAVTARTRRKPVHQKIPKGTVFARLTVVRFVEWNPERHRARYLCRCECGQTCFKDNVVLTSGEAESCGCVWRARTSLSTRLRATTHGLSKSSEYKSWRAMKARCDRPTCASYIHYGMRGIKVCERWANSFENFFSDMGARPTSTHSLDRIDVNGNYEPANCRWATATQQNNNRRPMKRIGQFTDSEMAEEFKRRGIRVDTP